MKPFVKKMKSSQGASILLALLFLLLCMTVAASVLMAAVSNAGKARSNREEQQKYLTLSSALRLVCDELTAAKYYGKYEYSVLELPGEEGPVSGGSVAGETKRYRHIYEQKEGEFICGLNGPGGAVLPMRDGLDMLFAENFSADGTQQEGRDEYEYRALSNILFQESHILTVAAQGEEEDYPGLGGQQVTVTVRLERSGVIYVKAVLGDMDGDGGLYVMEAELAPNALPGEPLAPDTDPDRARTPIPCSTEPTTWSLSWIVKRGGTADEG